MSDVKEVGIIGQAYEDRTTGKVGVLNSRDDKCKTLMMLDENGKGFNVSYSSFRSRWRKAVEKTDEDETVKLVTAAAVEPSDDSFEIFEDDNGCKHIIKHGIEIVCIKQCKDGTYSVSCLPDIYTLSDTLRSYTSNFKCSFTKSGLDVSFKVSSMPFEELKSLLNHAVVNINLYGYTEE